MSQSGGQPGKLAILVNSLGGGGAEKVATVLFEEFRKIRPDVVLVCLEKNDVYEVEAGQAHYLSSLSGGREGGLKKLFSILTLAFRLRAFVRTNNISLVQSHLYRSNYVNVMARIFGSKHRIQIVNHGIASNYLGEGIKGKINLRLVRWLYPAADELICPSAGMLADLQANGVRLPAARVIGNPFDIVSIKKQAAEGFEDCEFQPNPSKRYLICVGRLEKVKRFDDVIRAYQALRSKYSNLELLVLGSGPEENSLRALTTRLGVSEGVNFVGHVKNPFKYIAGADVLVASSRYEGFSNVIVEALACGTCVASSDCPSGPREILAPGTAHLDSESLPATEPARYGILFAVGDVGQIVESVITILQNADLAKIYRERGAHRANEFDVPLVARAYLESGATTS